MYILIHFWFFLRSYAVCLSVYMLLLFLRYLLPSLCHLSAEDGPRRVLLSLDTPAMLVDFLSKGWASLRGQSGKTVTRDPSLETACSALLNFAITEPERVRYTQIRTHTWLKLFLNRKLMHCSIALSQEWSLFHCSGDHAERSTACSSP